MGNVVQREEPSERMGKNRAITLVDNYLGPGAFARPLIYSNEILPHFTVKEVEAQRR